MAKETIENQLRRSGAGRKQSKPSMSLDTFARSTMDPFASGMLAFKNALPDPDEIFQKGLISYQELYDLTRDSHATSCIEQRKSQTLSHKIRIEAGPGASGAQSERAIILCRRMLDLWGQNMHDTISQILEARLMGMQPFELNWFWDDVAGGLISQRPKDLLQEWFVFGIDGDLRFQKTRFANKTDPVPPFKVLLARNQPTMRNPYGKKLLSPCFWPVTFKRGGMRFFAEYAEKFGMPMFNIEGNTQTSDQELEEFASMLMRLARQGVIATRGKFKVTLSDMSSKYPTTNMYDTFMDAMDKEVSKALLGQTLTTDEGGSRAQGDIHKQILETLWKSDDNFVASVLTDLFDMVTYVNFGAGVIGPVAKVGESMGLERLERDKVLRDFHGIEFSDEYFHREYSLLPSDFQRVDPLKASYKDLPESNVAKGNGGNRPSEAAKDASEARQNHRNRG